MVILLAYFIRKEPNSLNSNTQHQKQPIIAMLSYNPIFNTVITRVRDTNTKKMVATFRMGDQFLYSKNAISRWTISRMLVLRKHETQYSNLKTMDVPRPRMARALSNGMSHCIERWIPFLKTKIRKETAKRKRNKGRRMNV